MNLLAIAYVRVAVHKQASPARSALDYTGQIGHRTKFDAMIAGTSGPHSRQHNLEIMLDSESNTSRRLRQSAGH